MRTTSKLTDHRKPRKGIMARSTSAPAFESFCRVVAACNAVPISCIYTFYWILLGAIGAKVRGGGWETGFEG